MTFSWIWRVKAYRVRASSAKPNAAEDAVTPAVSWRAPGDRVTVVANFAGFNGWEATSVATGVFGSEVQDPYSNGGAYSFTVTEAVDVLAKYRSGSTAVPAAPTGRSITISVNNPDLEELMSSDASLALGENTTYDCVASFAGYASDVVDSTGGVWRCTGWVQNGVTNSVSEFAGIESAQQVDIELVWEFQEPVPEIVILDPVPVGIGSISHVDGKWSITIPDAKKGWRYYLYSSSNLSDLSGDSSTWPKDESVGENPLEAAEDGSVVFRSIPSGGSMFWRAMEQEIRK